MRYELTDHEWVAIRPMLPSRFCSRVCANFGFGAIRRKVIML
jgi:transposase